MTYESLPWVSKFAQGSSSRSEVRKHQGAQGANVWRIVDLLLAHPVVNADVIATSLGIAPRNVYVPVEPRLASGILTLANDRRRGQIWRSTEVLEALDNLAARAGKRQRPPSEVSEMTVPSNRSH